jgi:hypothetical protein
MAATPTSATKASRDAKKATAKTDESRSGSTATFTCPECGRQFERAAGLGAHRSRVHGVAGSSSSAKAAGRRRNGSTRVRARKPATTARRGAPGASDNGGAAPVDRDALLAALFPNGVPPRESVIREVAQWLDQAERLAKLR